VQLREYLRLLTKRAWLIILVMILAAGAAFGFSKLLKPVYRSTIYLNVYPARLDWGLQQSIQNLMRNYAGVIGSRDVAAEVNDRLQLDITPDQLREKLTISSIESDFLLEIDADDYDPLIARDIAQTTAEVFVENIKVRMLEQDQRDRVDVSIRDSALPGYLHKPKVKINTLAGALFGLVAGILLVYVLEWLETDVIRSAEDIERHTKLVILGAIPATAGSHPRPLKRVKSSKRGS